MQVQLTIIFIAVVLGFILICRQLQKILKVGLPITRAGMASAIKLEMLHAEINRFVKEFNDIYDVQIEYKNEKFEIIDNENNG